MMGTLGRAGSDERRAFNQFKEGSLQELVFDSIRAMRKAGCGKGGGKGGMGLFVRPGHFVKANSIASRYPYDLRHSLAKNEDKIPEHLSPYIVYISAQNAKKMGRSAEPLCVVPRSLSPRRGQLAFFANHSSSKRLQNAELQSRVVNGALEIFIITTKNIDARNGGRREIYVNYRGKYAKIIDAIVAQQRLHAARVIVPRRTASFFCQKCKVRISNKLTFAHRSMHDDAKN